MRLVVIFLIAFLAGASAKDDSLSEGSAAFEQQCGSFYYTLLRTLSQSGDKAKKAAEENAITIRSKDNQIKELEMKVAELQANLELMKEKEIEYETKLKSNDDLVVDVGLKLDNLRNKVAHIAEIKSNRSEPKV
ncbi:hypothetical protein AWZ03_002397 [Drosophila navojoa]|uniref:Uncharacterized protein n=1 Tax=Drosophila navojoa TaxID=7232 RepID=A0A484BT99_DRONA|nr:uncharacterized protein LOC108651238 [Drosophila navojoa]TDG51310.1 hypothetical protein AWZ03_002397 [Drosophila navojoa]